jgi:hypothetical protein
MNQDDNDQMVTNIVFVDSLTTTYTEASEIGENGSTSLSKSPFKNKSAHDCYLLLKRLRENTGSDIDCELFAIMDQRSLEDDTLFLVQGPLEESGEAESVRAAFDIANGRLLVYLVGDTDVLEDQERVQNMTDRVLRRS